VQSQVPEDVDIVVLLAKIQQTIVGEDQNKKSEVECRV
jgi:hypothetical protein